jgi:hypothetical protein
MFLQGFPGFLDVVKYFNATWHSAGFYSFENLKEGEIYPESCVASLIVKSTRRILL